MDRPIQEPIKMKQAEGKNTLEGERADHQQPIQSEKSKNTKNDLIKVIVTHCTL
jgi:hypothetical protein